MGKKFGFSFSARRASGLSGIKGRISRKTGIPLTRSGRQRKVGRASGCCVAAFIFLASLAAGGFLLSFASRAGEVYMWVDEKGVKHITDCPPEKTAKIIEKETYRKDSPEEIERYQQQRELQQKLSDLETERQRKINQLNEAFKDSARQQKEQRRQYEIERAKEDLSREEKRQNKYADERRNSNSKWEADLYNDLKKDQDREVEAKRRKLIELENSK